MIIVRLQGGLGNQLFQYALYEKLKALYPEERVLLDKTSYRVENPHNGYELENLFQIAPYYATDKEIYQVTGRIPLIGFGRPLLSRKDFLHKIVKKGIYIINRGITRLNDCSAASKSYDPVIYQLYESGYAEEQEIFKLDLSRSWYFNGTWFHCDFSGILPTLHGCFSLKKSIPVSVQSWMEQMKSGNSVSIHVRRGDYGTWNYKILDAEYYIEAIEYIKSNVCNPVFFVFSDEIEAVKNEFSQYPNFSKEQFVFIQGNEGENAYLDMILMSACRHNILANSTFSAAADLLNCNENRITIAPKYWMEKKKTWNNGRWILI